MHLVCLILKCAFLVIAFFDVSFGQSIATCNNCCQDYESIDNSRRSVQSQWSSGQEPLCDMDLQPRWYRFTSFVGGKMSTTKVDINHCGTKAPIWLDGNHPGHSDPVIRVKACVNIFERNFGCFSWFYVSIKYCVHANGDFYVYFLQPTFSCYLAYCAGDGQPCPYGQTGSSLASCKAAPEKVATSLLGRPSITYKDEEQEAVSLLCIVSLDDKIRAWKNVTYEIVWKSEGRILKTEQPFCLPANGLDENTEPCPPDKEIRSILYGGRDYEAGQWVKY